MNMLNTSPEITSPLVLDIHSKDVAYTTYLDNSRKWEEARKLDKKIGTNTAGDKPEPDEAAKRGQEFSEMRFEISKEFYKQRDKVDSKKSNSFDKLPSIIDKTENPTDKLVKMATYLDLVSNYLPEISIPGGVDALKRCPEALDLASRFKDKMMTTVANLKPAFLRGRTGLVDEVAAIVLPLADKSKRSEIVEVTGEAIGAGLFEGMMNSNTRSVASTDVLKILGQKGINLGPEETSRSLNYEALQNLLVDEAIKMGPGDMRDKTLGVALGVMSQVEGWLPGGRNGQAQAELLKVMKSVLDTLNKINTTTVPDLPQFFQSKLTEIKSNMQYKRSSWY